MVKNNLNPKFEKKVEMEYYFEQTQQLRFLVYDSDGKNLDKLEDHDFIGSLEVPPPPPPLVLSGHAASLTPY